MCCPSPTDVDAGIPPVSWDKRTKHTAPCPSQTTGRNIWQDNWRMVTADQRCFHVTACHWRRMLKEAQMCKKKLCQSWLQRRDLWIVYKLFLSWDWSVRADQVDRLSLPYSVLWINLFIFCCCYRICYPGEGAQAQQIYSTPVLQCRKDKLGKGKRASETEGMLLTNTSKHGAC